MIEFKGEISKRSKKILLKKQMGYSVFAMMMFLAITVPPIVLLAVYINLFYIYFLFLIVFGGLALLLNPLYSVNPPSQVEIEDGVIYITCGYGVKSRDLIDVKKVIDYGECYYIAFHSAHLHLSCICQKDLIVQGTIEEFEELFKLYIVRKDGK